MALNQTLIDQINTPVNGGNAPPISGSDAGASGITADPTTENYPGNSFDDPSASLVLTPSVTGGAGGTGTAGANGASAAPTETASGQVVEYDYTAGEPGGIGGAGGAGSAATFDFSNEAIGSSSAPLGGEVEITAHVQGGAGAVGSNGGSGGDGGFDEVDGPPSGPHIVYAGAEGGEGSQGGNGGDGGAATAAIDGLSETASHFTEVTLVATGGTGATGGYGGGGGNGGEASAGGTGGSGADGGAATASITNSTITDPVSLLFDLQATGGGGGNGGGGWYDGYGIDRGNINNPEQSDPSVNAPWTAYYTNGLSGAGGIGGANGAGTVLFTGNTLASFSTVLELTATGGAQGSGGAGGGVAIGPAGATTDSQGDITNIVGDTPGATGSTGLAVPPGEITMTGNIVTSDYVALTLRINATNGGTLSPVALTGGGGGNLDFSGNSFTGTGDQNSQFDVSGMGPGVTLNALVGLVSIDGSPGNSMTGYENFSLGSGDTFIDGAGTVEYVYLAPHANTIVITPDHPTLVLYSATGVNTATNTVLEFANYGSALDLSQLQADTTSSGGNVTINVPGDGSVTLTQTNWTATASDTAFVTEAVSCLLAGTRISTPDGWVPVEHLAVGDPVLTMKGAARPIVWLGRRRIDCRRHPAPRMVWPVRISAHAFGPDQPACDLFLSPDHAVFVSDVLIPVKYLINGTTISQVSADRVTYFHLELPRHDVVLADGLPVESLLQADRADFENGTDVHRLHPEFCSLRWDAAGCVPLVVTGVVLAAVRRRLAERSDRRAIA